MSYAEALRAHAALLEETAMCLCAVGPADLAEPEPCPNCRKARALRDEAEALDREQGR